MNEPKLHHWWPIGLSSYWADSEGLVSRLSWDSAVKKAPPKNWGALTHGHRAKLAEGWKYSIEGDFGPADTTVPHVVAALQQATPTPGRLGTRLGERMTASALDDVRIAEITDLLASLVVRSLGFRNRQLKTVEHYRAGIPFRDRDDAHNLVVMNLAQQYAGIARSMRRRGKLVILYTKSEFIFGEGFLNDLSPGGFGSTKCLVPLTPSIAVLFCAPMAYSTLPRAISLSVDVDETEAINSITQIYSGSNVYFRSIRPRNIEYLALNEFQQLQYDTWPWLEDVIQQAASFRSRTT